MALEQSELAILIAWISGIVTADEACRALGDESGPLTRMEMIRWEMDAIETGRLIVAERLAALPPVSRIEVLPGKRAAA